MGSHNLQDKMKTMAVSSNGRFFKVASDEWLWGWCTTVPSSATGYSPGFQLLHRDGDSGDLFLINKGTKASSNFQPITDLIDNEYLRFGTGDDITAHFDATNLLWTGASENIGEIRITNVPFRIGTSTSDGITLSATYPIAMRVYADDNGTAIDAAQTINAAQFRLMASVAAQSEAEFFSCLGKFVAKACTLDHNTAGILGSWEQSTTAATVTGPQYGNIHAGVLGRVGGASITVSATGILAGLSSMNNCATSPTVTSGGIWAGMYVGAWGGAAGDWNYGIYCRDVRQCAYFNGDLATISGEEHAFDIVTVGTISSGDSIVGLNVTCTPTGTAGSWASGAYIKLASGATKVINGYNSALELELALGAYANPSDGAVLVLNSTNTCTGSPANMAYIYLREYGTDTMDIFARFVDQSRGAASATAIVCQTNDTTANTMVRCMVGTTPFWLLASTTAPS